MESLNRVCLDTDVLIDYLRKPSAEITRAMESVFEKKLNACITSVNAFEIWLGADQAPEKSLSRCTEDFLSQLEVVDFDYTSAVEAGKVLADLKKRGEPLDIRDLFVACICKVNDMTLISRNLKQYKRVRGLTVLTPEQIFKKLR